MNSKHAEYDDMRERDAALDERTQEKQEREQERYAREDVEMRERDAAMEERVRGEERIDMDTLHAKANALAENHGQEVNADTKQDGWGFMAVLDILVRTERADSLRHDIEEGFESRRIRVR